MLKVKLFKTLPLNSRFLLGLLAFVVINLVGLKYEGVFKNNSAQHIKAVGKLEELKTYIYKQRHLIAYIQIQQDLEKNKVDQSILSLIIENNGVMREMVREVQSYETKGLLGVPSIREIYFDSAWRVDEGFTHFRKMTESYVRLVKDHNRSDLRRIDRYFLEIEKHGENLLNSLIPIQQELLMARDKYYEFITINDYVFRVSVLLMAIAVYFYLYRPWKKQVNEFTNESKRLKEILSESEKKGNIYTWELNYHTKEIMHSKHLASIFNLVDDSEFAYLYDEISSFDAKSRELFLEGIENCVHKEEELEITVHVTTKNKSSYWLRYNASKTLKGDQIWISGTVQDVTPIKVAEKRFDDLFNELNIPLIIFGDGHVREMNSSAQKFFGINEEESYKLLHPAVMFPLYQEDGRSSLEKLTQCLEEMQNHRSVKDTWSFHTAIHGTISAKTTMFNIMYNESNLHMMIISDNKESHDLEERLINAHRKAQYSRRSKIEYIVQNGVVLESLIESAEKAISRINSEEDYSEAEKEIDMKIIENIRDKAHKNWVDCIHRPIEEGYGHIIFDFEEMLNSLHRRWNRMTGHDIRFKLDASFLAEGKKYFWGDILKIKAILIGVVDNALHTVTKGTVTIYLHHMTARSNQEHIKVEVSCDDPAWPGNDWSELKNENSSHYMGELISPKKVFSLIEYVDGDLELHKSSKNLIHNGKIKLSFSVRSVHGKMFKGDHEVYFMMNREEYFVPYNESAISSTEIWSHFGGDWDLIESAIRDFINYYPQVVSDIQFGLEEKDGDIIYNAASELYGVLTHFPFFKSIDRVVLMQKYGEYLKFSQIEAELDVLIKELLEFSNVLEEFLPQAKDQAA